MRASLERFIDDLGYEAVLFEKGDVPYAHGQPLDESCYTEVGNADIFVLIVGGRYGSPSSRKLGVGKSGSTSGDEIASVSREEFRRADERGIPIWVLVDSAVLSELETYRKNRTSGNVVYAHVDSTSVFEFLEEILAKGKPYFAFTRPLDVEEWLCAQWAGRFRDLIRANVHQKPVEDLAVQVETLKATTKTLQSYLEKLVRTVLPGKPGRKVVARESADLTERVRVLSNPFVRHLLLSVGVDEATVLQALRTSTSYQALIDRLEVVVDDSRRDLVARLRRMPRAFDDVNLAREALGLDAYQRPRDFLIIDAANARAAGRRASGEHTTVTSTDVAPIEADPDRGLQWSAKGKAKATARAKAKGKARAKARAKAKATAKGKTKGKAKARAS